MHGTTHFSSVFSSATSIRKSMNLAWLLKWISDSGNRNEAPKYKELDEPQIRLHLTCVFLRIQVSFPVKTVWEIQKQTQTEKNLVYQN